MKISVSIATYNGEKYLKEQIDSILEQLASDDEVIVVDDCSTDNTVMLLQSYGDSRIKIYLNDRNRSHVYSFGRAISLATNDIIFMADQDDVWIKGRVSVMRDALNTKSVLLVSSNSEFMNALGDKINFPIDGVKEINSKKHFQNILDIFAGKTNYYGCAMVFRKDLATLMLPIPSYVESHDLWIALAANIMGSNAHINASTLLRRVHDENASIIDRNIVYKLWSRLIFLISVVHLLIRSLTISKRYR